MLGRVPRSRGLKRRGRYEVDKVPVFAFVERGGARLFTTAKDVTESTILALVEQRIEPGSKAYTDEYPPYKTLNTIYNHESVDHSIGEYVRGGVHINTCEADFSILRPFTALHRGVAKYNIQLYTKFYQLHRHSATQRAYKHYNKQSKQPYS
jgi:transposase-like protein